MADSDKIESIELTVDSCKDLKVFNLLKKVVAYAVVWIDDRKKRQKTPRDPENNRDPEWKHRMWFDMDRLGYTTGAAASSSGLSLEFKIRVDGVMGVGKTIGRVQVPIKDLVDAYTGSNTASSYQITGSNDEHTGLLNFYYTIEYHKVDGGGSSLNRSVDLNQSSHQPQPKPASDGPMMSWSPQLSPPRTAYNHQTQPPVESIFQAKPAPQFPMSHLPIGSQPPGFRPPYAHHQSTYFTRFTLQL